MTNDWEPELLENKPKETTLLNDGSIIQRRDIHEVEYHSLDGTQTFKGYECFTRVISNSKI